MISIDITRSQFLIINSFIRINEIFIFYILLILTVACNINELDVPVNGKIDKHSTHSGSGSATIACQTGYKTNGNTAASCVNSKWTKLNAFCEGMYVETKFIR